MLILDEKCPISRGGIAPQHTAVAERHSLSAHRAAKPPGRVEFKSDSPLGDEVEKILPTNI